MPVNHNIAKFWDWWVTGLAIPLPLKQRSQRFVPHLLITESGDNGEIAYVRDPSGQAKTTHPLSFDEAANNIVVQQWLSRNPTLNSLPVVLRLNADRVLRKIIRYPSSVRNELRQVVTFDIDRQTPFMADDVHFSYHVIHESPTDEYLEIELLVVPSVEIARFESVINSFDRQISILDCESHTFFAQQTNFLPEDRANANRSSAHGIHLFLVFLLLLLILAIPGKIIWDSQALIAELKTEHERAHAKAAPLAQLREEHTKQIEQQNFFVQFEAPGNLVLDLLLGVTKLLPDDTWIQRFDLKTDKLVLHGESGNASDIPALLEGSAYFSASRFLSPVTRNRNTGKDRFQIEVTVNDGGPL